MEGSSGGSDGCGRAATGSELGSLSNPQLASMTAAELVVYLHSDRRGSSFADAALVLAARERSAADAEARIREAGEVAGRLRDEIRRAADTEARLRAEIRALGGRPDEADARAAPGSSDVSGRHRSVASEDDDGAAGVKLEAGEIAADELGAQDQDPSVAASEEDGGDADVDPDDALTLNQYLGKVKLPQRGNDDDDASENLRALAIVSSPGVLDVAPLEVILPGDDRWPDHGRRAWEWGDAAHVGGTGDFGDEAQNSGQDLPRSVGSMASSESEVDGAADSTSSDTGTSPVVHSEAGGGRTLEPSSSTVPPRAPNNVPREQGLFYNMVLKALREREQRALAKAAAASSQPQPNLRCWLYAPLPSESVDVEEDPHAGEAPQK